MAEKGPSVGENSQYFPEKDIMDSQTLPQDVADSLSRPSAEIESHSEEVKPEPAKDEERQYLTGIKLYMVVTGVTLVCFLVLLDIAIIVTVSSFCLTTIDNSDASQAIPVITTHFHSLEDIGWYGSSYQIARYGLLAIRSCRHMLTGRLVLAYNL